MITPISIKPIEQISKRVCRYRVQNIDVLMFLSENLYSTHLLCADPVNGFGARKITGR